MVLAQEAVACKDSETSREVRAGGVALSVHPMLAMAKAPDAGQLETLGITILKRQEEEERRYSPRAVSAVRLDFHPSS